MAKVYKSGEWAKSGRVLPYQRKKEKKIDQILQDGTVIVADHDQKFLPKEFKNLLLDIFPDGAEKNGRIFLPKKSEGGKSVAFYTRNIYHLGGNWSSEKKRIEIGKDFLEFYQRNEERGTESVLLGCYHWYPDGKDGVLLFVCFSAKTYASRDLNNSAAHIHTLDLQNALKNGVWRRLDKSGNEILVLDKANFAAHINALRGDEELPQIKSDRRLLDYFSALYSSLPKTLYGIKCYEEMFAADDPNKRQAAWEGWYVEFYVKKYLREHPNDKIEWWSSKKTGELDFDLKFLTEENFYGDIKADDATKNVQGNKKSNVDILVKECGGRLWYVVFEFTPERDDEHENQTAIWWNKKLGKTNLLSYHTRMKYAIKLDALNIYEINQFAFKYLKEFCVSPCDGKPREPKYLIPAKMKEFLRIYRQENKT